MNSKKVFVEGSTEPLCYRCDHCGFMYHNEEDAKKCCIPVTCSICGREISTDKTKCREYFYTVEDKVECCDCHRKKIEDSWPTITEEEYWNLVREDNSNFGPVVLGDKWYSDLAEAVEDLTTEDILLEDLKDLRFQVGQIQKPVQLHLDRLLEWEYEDWGLEDYDINSVWEDLPELQDFVKEWNKKQTFRMWDTTNMWVTLSEETIKENFDWLFEEV